MYCMYGIKFTVKNTVFYNNIRIFESPIRGPSLGKLPPRWGSGCVFCWMISRTWPFHLSSHWARFCRAWPTWSQPTSLLLPNPLSPGPRWGPKPRTHYSKSGWPPRCQIITPSSPLWPPMLSWDSPSSLRGAYTRWDQARAIWRPTDQVSGMNLSSWYARGSPMTMRPSPMLSLSAPPANGPDTTSSGRFHRWTLHPPSGPHPLWSWRWLSS